jgi:hypothetical protein
MSEEERDHLQYIEEIIGKKIDAKMNPIYFLFGILILIYIAVAGPLTMAVINIATEQKSKATKEDLDVAIKERERDYLKKYDYYQIEADEHRMLKEAFIMPTDPTKAGIIFEQINDNIATSLGFKYTTRGVNK